MIFDTIKWMQQLALIVHNIRSSHNVGSIMRTADCFGISVIYMSGYTPYPALDTDDRLPHLAHKINAQIAKTALGAEKTIPFRLHPTIEAALSAARTDGYSIAVLEQDEHSIPLSSHVFKNPTAIVIGNEIEGVDEWTKRSADVILEIPQYGSKESLNVANATAIALYAARTRIQKL